MKNNWKSLTIIFFFQNFLFFSTYYSTFLNLDNYDDDSDNVHEEELIAIKKKLKINPCLHNFKGYRDEKMKICEDNGFIFKVKN